MKISETTKKIGKKKEINFEVYLSRCTPAGARTLDTLIKSQVLYQLSYGCVRFLFAGAKVQTFREPTKLFEHFF